MKHFTSWPRMPRCWVTWISPLALKPCLIPVFRLMMSHLITTAAEWQCIFPSSTGPLEIVAATAWAASGLVCRSHRCRIPGNAFCWPCAFVDFNTIHFFVFIVVNTRILFTDQVGKAACIADLQGIFHSLYIRPIITLISFFSKDWLSCQLVDAAR